MKTVRNELDEREQELVSYIENVRVLPDISYNHKYI